MITNKYLPALEICGKENKPGAYRVIGGTAPKSNQVGRTTFLLRLHLII
jgi:hypothetical protein